MLINHLLLRHISLGNGSRLDNRVFGEDGITQRILRTRRFRHEKGQRGITGIRPWKIFRLRPPAHLGIALDPHFIPRRSVG